MVFLPSVRVLPGEAVERDAGLEVAEPQQVRASNCESFLPSLTKRYLNSPKEMVVRLLSCWVVRILLNIPKQKLPSASRNIEIRLRS